MHLPLASNVVKLAIQLAPTPKFYLPNGELCMVNDVWDAMISLGMRRFSVFRNVIE
jgi:hypothetical protein